MGLQTTDGTSYCKNGLNKSQTAKCQQISDTKMLSHFGCYLLDYKSSYPKNSFYSFSTYF